MDYRVIIPQSNLIHFVDHSQIIYCKSDNCYTNVHLTCGQRYFIVKSLSRFSKELGPEHFIRVSQSYLINRTHIKTIDKKNKIIDLLNDHKVPFTITLKDLLSELMR